MMTTPPNFGTATTPLNKYPVKNCNLKVLSIEEFNKIAESIGEMTRVALLDSVEAFSTSPDCISVKWKPNAKLSPHIAAYKVRYSEISDQLAAANSLSTSTLQPLNNPTYTEQEYVSEFLSSNSREYSIARLSPATRYSVCVSAYPSSIEYWAKFGDNMKKCVDLETNPPPDVIAWLVLGLMGFLLISILILAAVVVHKRRFQARQSRTMRLAASPADYETPVVLVAAGGAGGQPAPVKQLPAQFSPVEKYDSSGRLLHSHEPPAYSDSPQNNYQLSHQLKGANNRKYVEGDPQDAQALAPMADLAEDDVSSKEGVGSVSDEPSRQPILLAAVVSRGKQNRPPLAHFTSKSCASNHTPKLHHIHPMMMVHDHQQHSPVSTPTLLPAQTDASDLAFFRAGAGQPRTGQYQHASKTTLLMMKHATLDDSSTSTSGYFNDEQESSTRKHSNASVSVESELAYHQQLPDLVNGKLEAENSLKTRRQNTLRRQKNVTAASTPPPPPPPYDGLPSYCVAGEKCSHMHVSQSNEFTDVDIDVQSDTDGLICVI